MSSRYRYNSQSYYNRSSGGQTNNPRVINRPYGIGYSSNQATNVQTWAYNLSHAGYYVNDSLESMANQLTKNGYYVSKEPPIQKFIVTKVAPFSQESLAVNINTFQYVSSPTELSLIANDLFIGINIRSNQYQIHVIQVSTSTSLEIADTYYHIFSNNLSKTVTFYDSKDKPLFNVSDIISNDQSGSLIYLYFETFQIDLPNN